ncbi:hypothetical protein, partial [Thermococcus sp.]
MENREGLRREGYYVWDLEGSSGAKLFFSRAVVRRVVSLSLLPLAGMFIFRRKKEEDPMERYRRLA